MKHLLFTVPPSTEDFTVTLGDHTLEVFEYTSPKSFIVSISDERDHVNITRYNADFAIFENISDGLLTGDLQLNFENTDVSMILPDVYGVKPEVPTYGEINVYTVSGETEDPFRYSYDFSIIDNSFYLGFI